MIRTRTRNSRALVALVVILLLAQLLFAAALLNFSFNVHVILVPDHDAHGAHLMFSTPAPAAGEKKPVALAQRSEVRSQRGSFSQPLFGDIVPAGFPALSVSRRTISASDTSVDIPLQAADRLQSPNFTCREARDGRVSPRARLGVIARAAAEAHHV